MSNNIININERIDISSIINFEKSITGATNVINYTNWNASMIEANCQHTLLIGNSLFNEYIPFISPFIGQQNKIENTSFLLYDLMYNKNEYKSNYKGLNHRTRTRRIRDPITNRLVARNGQEQPIDPTEQMFEIKKLNYADIEYSLSQYIIPRTFENEQFMFQVGKGIIFEFNSETKEYDLLLVLGVKSSYYKQAKLDNDQGKLNLDNFAIFISNLFVDDERYKLVYKKIKKDYIDLANEAGIDIVYTNSIENRLFKNGSVKPKFKTIVEMNQFLEKINDNIHQYIKTD